MYQALPEQGKEQSSGSGVTLPINDEAQIYKKVFEQEAPHVLGLIDREEFSPTFGCLDRTYWAWKFTDFPGARFQEGLCFLSFLFGTEFDGNQYHQQPKLLEWIAGGFDFWSRIQRKSGDFDEAYPYERSLAATAFTTFYLAEAWNFLDGHLPGETADHFRESIERAGDWLIKNDEGHGFLSNHLAAAAAALFHVYRISGEDRFEARSRYFIEKILNYQSQEGWYDEYGGADPGYQTHGSFYLARILELGGDDRQLVESLERSCTFLAHFIHPDGSLGGEYASRNTQTYYPAAFEMLSATSGTARWIADTMRPSVVSLKAVGLGSVDAYNYFPLLNNYVFAYLASLRAQERAKPEAPAEQTGMQYFPEAGILKVRSERYDAYVSVTKGGVLKAFDRHQRRLVLNDCGYIGKLKSGGTLSSQWQDKERRIDITEDKVTVEGSFYKIDRPVLKPYSFLGFRAFSLTVGRLPRASYWLKSLLVKVLIYRKRNLNMQFKREISFDPDQIRVKDHINGPIGDRVASLKWMDAFTTVHMGSSRYFVPNELELSNEASEVDPNLDVDQLERGITLERSILLD